jgi:hypothetical protein
MRKPALQRARPIMPALANHFDILAEAAHMTTAHDRY